MPFPEFDPFVPFLHWGSIGVRWYALAYVAGIILGWLYALKLIQTADRWGPAGPPLTSIQMDDLILWLTLGIILGGRLGYMVFYDLDELLAHPTSAFKVWQGGMSFHGGMIGVVLAISLFSWRKQLDLLRVGDLIAPVAPIGLLFGRLANFINGELWGRPTDLPFGVIFCNPSIIKAYGVCPAGMSPRHPSQLYEAALEGLLLLIVLGAVAWKTDWLQRRRGALAGLFLLGYGLVRMALENVRNPDLGMPEFPLGLTMGMILSIPMIVGGAWLLWQSRGVRNAETVK